MSDERDLATRLAPHRRAICDRVAQAWRSHAPKSTVLLSAPQRSIAVAEALTAAWFSWLDNTRDVGVIRALAEEQVRQGLIYSAASNLARAFTEAIMDLTEADEHYTATALRLTQHFTAAWLDHVAMQHELRALQERERLAQHLHASAEAGRAVAATRDIDELQRQIVNLLADRFGYAFAAIYAIELSGREAGLREASGEIGEALKNRGHRLPLDGSSLVAAAARTRQTCINNDVVQSLDAPVPNGRSEIALPLLAGEELLGILNVHALETEAFDKTASTLLETIADQLAMALDNARLFEQTQQALGASHATQQSLLKFRRAIEQSTDAVFMTDLDGTIVYVNPAFEKVYGFTAAEAVGQTPRIIKSGIIPQERYREFWAALLNRQVVAGEIINKAKDGRLVPVEGSNMPIVDDDNQLVGFVAVHRDITRRKREEEALRHSQAELSEALRIAHLGYWEYDVANDTFTFNDQFYALLRTTAEAEGGYIMPSARYAQKFVHPGDAYLVGEEIGRALASTDPDYRRQIDHRIIYADGSEGFITVRFRVERDAAGHPIKFIGANEDITERKQAEEALRRSEERLSEALRIAHLGYWEYDVANDTFTFNDQFYALLRTTAEAEGGYIMPSARYAQKFVHPGDAYLVGEEIGRALASTDPDYRRQIDHRIIYADGSEGFITVRFRVERDAAGHPIKFIGANEDITERKQAEIERERLLVEQQRRTVQLQTAAEVSRAAASILEPNALIDMAVKLVRERFGLYYVGIFLLDESGEWAQLRAGTGEAGRAMLAAGHRLRVDESSMIGWCIANRRARIALDVGDEAVRFDNPLLPATRSEMALPLINRGHVMGAATIQSSEPNAFGADDIVVLQTMADQLTAAVANARLFEQAQRTTRQLAAINDLVRAVSQEIELPRMLEAAYEQIRQNMPTDVFIVALYDADTDMVSYPSIYNAGQATTEPPAPLRPASNIGRVIRTGEPILVHTTPEELAETTTPPDPIGDASRPTASLLYVPLKSGAQLIGVLSVQSYAFKAYTAEHISLLHDFATQLVIGIRNAQLIEETRRTAQELDAINRRLTGEAWRDFVTMAADDGVIWHSNHQQLAPLGEAEAAQLTAGQVFTQPDADEMVVSVPVMLRGQLIGALRLRVPADRWTGDLATIVTTVAGHLAQSAENIRLIEQTRRNALREKEIAAAADRIYRAGDLDAVLYTAVNEIRRITGADEVGIHLGTLSDNTPGAGGNGHRSTPAMTLQQEQAI